MVLKKDNVERIADGEGADWWKRKGYQEVREMPVSVKTGLHGMKIDELRVLAAEQGIEGAESFTKKDLLAALKGLGI